MMMDEMLVDQIVDVCDGDGAEQQEARWARPPLVFGEDYSATSLGKTSNFENLSPADLMSIS